MFVQENSLAETLQVFPVRGQIARTLPESSDASARELEGAAAPALLVGDQFQSAPDDFGLAASRGGFQFVEDGPIFRPETRVDVSLHGCSGSTELHRRATLTDDRSLTQHRHETLLLTIESTSNYTLDRREERSWVNRRSCYRARSTS